jgi:hypothetical protein
MIDEEAKLYAPFSVVVGPCEPFGLPFASQFAYRAASNQET